MSDYSPVYAAGIKPFTVTASATVTGGTFVETTTTGAVGPAGALSLKVVGVAAHDAASGARLSVWPIPGIMHEVTHTAGGTVGDCIVPAAAGAAGTAAAGTASAAGYDLGVAVTTAGAGLKIRFVGR